MHKNVRLTPRGRERIVMPVRSGQTATAVSEAEGGSTRSDIFLLGVITCQLPTGRWPYGTQVPKSRIRAQQKWLRYNSARDDQRENPAWIGTRLRKAAHPGSAPTL